MRDQNATCIACPPTGSCRNDEFLPPDDGGLWQLNASGACVLVDCGARNVTKHGDVINTEKTRLPSASAECSYCAEGFRFDDFRQACVECDSSQLTCINSKITSTRCHFRTQYYDLKLLACEQCPERYQCRFVSCNCCSGRALIVNVCKYAHLHMPVSATNQSHFLPLVIVQDDMLAKSRPIARRGFKLQNAGRPSEQQSK